MYITLSTKLGPVKGNVRNDCNEYLGVRYATAKRFEYAKVTEAYDGEYDATQFGEVCPQTRAYYEHLEIPERMFYHKEFRDGIKFKYGEDCLNVNIYTPKKNGKYPVIVFFHGGGFNSGANSEDSFDGGAYAKRDVIMVVATYRVGVLGYLTDESIFNKYGHDGNFGLDDQVVCLKWVKENIADYGGDPDNITLMGQSAGAISIQYMCLNEDIKGMFKRAIMLSGGGLFPKFSLPRLPKVTREYWKNFYEICGVTDLDGLRNMDLDTMFSNIEKIKEIRKDNTFCTMPVVDGYLIKRPVDEMIEHPLPVDYMIGFTNNDMYAFLMAKIGTKFARDNNGYLYYFDIDAPGTDKNGAFHSSDLRYVFGTLMRSFRPYTIHDYEVSGQMIDYISSFADTGNPNGDGRPVWERGGKKALCISGTVRMGRPNRCKLLWNTITKGDPK